MAGTAGHDAECSRIPALRLAGVTLLADLSGALFWEEQSLLVVSDLHLEKGSSFAARGVLLPPYDTVATLSRLAAVIARHDPRMVIALGDSFHDRDAHARLSAPTARRWRRCRRGATGSGSPAITIRPCRPISAAWSRPKSRSARSRSATSRPARSARSPAICIPRRGCRRAAVPWSGAASPATANALVMPAFGAYTGGLSIRDRAFAKIFGAPAFMAHVLGDSRVHSIAASRCY